MELLLGLNRERSTTPVTVTHDEQQDHKTGRLVRFFDGRQVAWGD
ncbi:hypothetical protein [Hymenobacter coccineus]|nr:hypothetical protein [Hymenobacter coccineus]